MEIKEHDQGEDFFLASSLFLDANDMDVCKELNMQWMRKLKLNGVDAWIIQSKKCNGDARIRKITTQKV
jgi:hypothetical protein